jgi:hypothetical protein
VESLQRAVAIEEQARTRLIALIRERLVASGRPLP